MTRGPILTVEMQKTYWPGGRLLPRPKLDIRGHLPSDYTVARKVYMEAAHKAGWSARAIATTLGVSRQLVEFHLSGREKE